MTQSGQIAAYYRFKRYWGEAAAAGLVDTWDSAERRRFVAEGHPHTKTAIAAFSRANHPPGWRPGRQRTRVHRHTHGRTR